MRNECSPNTILYGVIFVFILMGMPFIIMTYKVGSTLSRHNYYSASAVKSNSVEEKSSFNPYNYMKNKYSGCGVQRKYGKYGIGF